MQIKNIIRLFDMHQEELEYLQNKMDSKKFERLREEFELLKNIKSNEDLECFLNTHSGYKGGGNSSPYKRYRGC